jgi:hypothetical protein
LIQARSSNGRVVDPRVQYVDGLNPYQYEGGAPANRTDATGLCCCGRLDMTAYGGGLIHICSTLHDPQGTCSGTLTCRSGEFEFTINLYDLDLGESTARDWDSMCDYCEHKCWGIPVFIIIPIEKDIEFCASGDEILEWLPGDWDWLNRDPEGECCVDVHCRITGGHLKLWECCEYK